MADPHPSLPQQIDAVEWAEDHAQKCTRFERFAEAHAVNILELCARLEAAAETLRTLEFGSAVAR